MYSSAEAHSELYIFNPIQDGPFRGSSRMRRSKKASVSKICHTNVTIIKLGTAIPYLKKIQNIYKSCDTVFEFCWHQPFFMGNQPILLYQERQIQIAFLCIISNSFDFFWVCKDCFNKHGYNFDDVSKTDTLGLLRIKVFWNKGYDIVTFFYDVTNKIYHVTQIIL